LVETLCGHVNREWIANRLYNEMALAIAVFRFRCNNDGTIHKKFIGGIEMLKDVATADSQLGALDSKAISWVEGVIRGRIVSAQLQARWARQHCFLTVECEGGHRKRLLLRSKKTVAMPRM
jgi:hypothetical protein